MPLTTAPHVRAADVGRDLILLDLSDDSYFCLQGADAEDVILGLRGDDHDRANPVIRELVDAELLCEVDDHVPTILDPTWPIDGMPPRGDTLASLTLIPAMVLGLVHYRLFRKSLLRRPIRVAPKVRLDDAGVARLVQRFRQLRILLPRSGRCFVQSWLLIRILRKRGIAAEWIFGVRTYPFEAHCWVEWQGRVLNDWADHVRWYDPIARF
ncbi:lasso peptide biosynthesis B2 protein [Sphingobium estronivorans]|uniref:lasso peptide biosynthesis B2 protein n=1 Tax=Sphingobium estronivorans TaxID=1577690 RepID=UPI001239EE96|nr:lasso peptide biosynthesis B2 protein [Sphingobium estronivorans]